MITASAYIDNSKLHLLFQEFEYLTRTFQLKLQEDGTYADDLEKFRLTHQVDCFLIIVILCYVMLLQAKIMNIMGLQYRLWVKLHFRVVLL